MFTRVYKSTMLPKNAKNASNAFECFQMLQMPCKRPMLCSLNQQMRSHMLLPLESSKWVRVGDNKSTANDRRRDGGASLCGVLLIYGQSVRSIEAVARVSNTSHPHVTLIGLLLVNDTRHSILAVVSISLATIEPDRASVLNSKLEHVGLFNSLAFLPNLP
jgi:hypothetical protein